MKTKMMAKLFFSLAIGSLVIGLVLAGSLDPAPGPPAPTMVTLQQIYDKLGALTGGLYKTGQTGCWSEAGTPINCAGTGQDGAFQKGISAFPRFTDNVDGTVKDNLTGLVWLKNANCFGSKNWQLALSDANSLASGACGLTDGSVAGAWRLPNVRELHSLVDFGQILPALPVGHPFSGVNFHTYWSSTTNLSGGTGAFGVNVGDFGASSYIGKTFTGYYVWPVRDGQ